jgi:6,7-dimethyl-8-ribityllumazine synthase
VIAEAGGTAEAVDVAGAYELPAALRMALSARASPRRRALGRLPDPGCVVRGETDHYTFICDAVCQGVMRIGAETGAAIGFAC